MAQKNLFASIPSAPLDPILGITEKFLADTNPHKVNLGVGVYQNGDGKSLKPSAVRKAEEKLFAIDAAAGYGPIDGSKEYNQFTQEFLFGKNSELITSGRVVTVQSPGGTGAIRLGAELLRLFFGSREVLISNPTWDNHLSLFGMAGFKVTQYPYYNFETKLFDYNACLSALKSAPNGSIVLLHACCHNPTGYDFSEEQWRELHSLCLQKDFIPFLDFAYQGFGQGIVEDTFSIRLFAESGMPCIISSSNSKNFGLYGDRIGALSVVTQNKNEADIIRSQLKGIVRTIYSNPPQRGAKIVTAICSDPVLLKEWEDELSQMKNRMKEMRQLFVHTLTQSGIDYDFSFVLKQNGMFSFSGLSKDVVVWLRENRSIYLIENGRICIAALNQKNIPSVCEGIAAAMKSVR